MKVKNWVVSAGGRGIYYWASVVNKIEFEISLLIQV